MNVVGRPVDYVAKIAILRSVRLKFLCLSDSSFCSVELFPDSVELSLRSVEKCGCSVELFPDLVELSLRSVELFLDSVELSLCSINHSSDEAAIVAFNLK
ncbi:MAG: hypothetical protein ABF497_14165 [Sporolactobacillus sp.]